MRDQRHTKNSVVLVWRKRGDSDAVSGRGGACAMCNEMPSSDRSEIKSHAAAAMLFVALTDIRVLS